MSVTFRRVSGRASLRPRPDFCILGTWRTRLWSGRWPGRLEVAWSFASRITIASAVGPSTRRPSSMTSRRWVSCRTSRRSKRCGRVVRRRTASRTMAPSTPRPSPSLSARAMSMRVTAAARPFALGPRWTADPGPDRAVRAGAPPGASRSTDPASRCGLPSIARRNHGRISSTARRLGLRRRAVTRHSGTSKATGPTRCASWWTMSVTGSVS